MVKDLVVDRGAFDRIIAAGGFISRAIGGAPDGNAILVPKENAGPRDGRGRLHRLRRLRRGLPERLGHALHRGQGLAPRAAAAGPARAPRPRARSMVAQMDAEGFGTCTNHGECEAACPKGIRVEFIARMNADYVKASATAGRRARRRRRRNGLGDWRIETDDKKTRTESDTMGKIEVPADRYWGAQTERSLAPLQASATSELPARADPRPRHPQEGLRDRQPRPRRAARRRRRRRSSRRPTRSSRARSTRTSRSSVWQTGSGTQTNMNANEVIANRAIEILGGEMGSKKPVHPNDDVNMSQSSNDTFPTAMHIAAVEQIRHRLIPAVASLRDTLDRKAKEFAGVVKIGRTHLQDAVPMTLGPGDLGLGLAARPLPRRTSRRRCRTSTSSRSAARPSAPGLNAPADFGHEGRRGDREADGPALRHGAQQVRGAGGARRPGLRPRRGPARSRRPLMKIANDVRWLASGPRSGLGEIRIPENEPGSSIMPGKVNPTQSEAHDDGRARRSSATTSPSPSAARRATSSSTSSSRSSSPTSCAPCGCSPTPAESFEEHCARGIEPDHEQDPRARRPLADAGHGARAAHRLRQGGARSPRRRTRTARRSRRPRSRSAT